MVVVSLPKLSKDYFMPKNILITGGAGFIGSHLCDKLINDGHYLRVLDILDEQVHGEGKKRPDDKIYGRQ